MSFFWNFFFAGRRHAAPDESVWWWWWVGGNHSLHVRLVPPLLRFFFACRFGDTRIIIAASDRTSRPMEGNDDAPVRSATCRPMEGNDASPRRAATFPSAGMAAVQAADNAEARMAELAKWEAELHEYSNSLAEDGWTSYRRSSMSNLMNELQRKVMPDAWRDEVQRAHERVASLQETVERGLTKERALLQRVDMLENGPGCARELQAEIEQLKARLNHQTVRSYAARPFLARPASTLRRYSLTDPSPAQPNKWRPLPDTPSFPPRWHAPPALSLSVEGEAAARDRRDDDGGGGPQGHAPRPLAARLVGAQCRRE